MENRTNILVWNLRFFDIGKITTYTRKPPQDGVEDPTWNPGTYRNYNDFYLGYLVDQLNPDVFIVVEPQSTHGSRGTLMDAGGAQGLLKLLSDLRMRQRAWSLVPPVRLNAGVDKRYTEGMGVFYRNDRLEFTGPCIWPAATSSTGKRIAAPLGSGSSIVYEEPWGICLPNRTVNINGVEYKENELAGQTLFLNRSQNEVGFPATTARSPFLTTFREKHDAQRNIAISSVHFPPSGKVVGKYKGTSGAAKGALRQVYRHIPIMANPPANTISILTGDFNIDRNDPNIERDLFGDTKTAASTWLLPVGTVTMNRPIGVATPFDYIGTSMWDNAILRFGPGLPITSKRYMIPNIVAGIGETQSPPQQPDPALPTVPSTIIPNLARFQASPQDDATFATFQEPIPHGHVALIRDSATTAQFTSKSKAQQETL
ncbi:MAG: hypothetical protein U0176_20780 [Bacteroidia bacterium]